MGKSRHHSVPFRFLFITVLLLAFVLIINYSRAQPFVAGATCVRSSDGTSYSADSFFGACFTGDTLICPQGIVGICYDAYSYTCSPLITSLSASGGGCSPPTILDTYTQGGYRRTSSGSTQPTTQSNTQQGGTTNVTLEAKSYCGASVAAGAGPVDACPANTFQYCETATDKICYLGLSNHYTCISSSKICSSLASSSLPQSRTRRYACVDKATNTCRASVSTGSNTTYSTLTACQSACVNPAPVEEPQILPQAPVTKFSCDTSTGLCKEDAQGSFNTKILCEASCKKAEPVIPEPPIQPEPEIRPDDSEPEKPEIEPLIQRETQIIEVAAPRFKTETACKRFYKRSKSQIKAQRLIWEQSEPPKDKPELKQALQACIQNAKQLEKDVTSPPCDNETAVSFDERIDDLNECIDTEILVIKSDEEEAPKRSSSERFRFSSELQEKALNDKIFSTEWLTHLFTGPVIQAVYQGPFSSEHRKNIAAGIQNMPYFSDRCQEEIVTPKQKLLEKVSEIDTVLNEKNVREEDRKLLFEAMTDCLKVNWGKPAADLVFAKFNQLTPDIRKGIKLSRLTEDLKASCEKRAKENGEDLFNKACARFMDCETDAWSFPYCQNPKQIAFKGDGAGRLNPTQQLSFQEAFISSMRAVQFPFLENCKDVSIPSSVKSVSPWAKCAISAAIEQGGGGEKGAKAWMLSDHVMTDPIPREIFAFIIARFLEIENISVTKHTEVDKGKVRENFSDCREVFKNDSLFNAVALLWKNNLMTGKGKEFGCYDSLLRQEAMRVLLQTTELATGGN